MSSNQRYTHQLGMLAVLLLTGESAWAATTVHRDWQGQDTCLTASPHGTSAGSTRIMLTDAKDGGRSPAAKRQMVLSSGTTRTVRASANPSLTSGTKSDSPTIGLVHNEQITTLSDLRPRGDYQVVEGFDSIVGASNMGSYQTYRGQAAQSYWEYAGFFQSVTWNTASVPSNYTKGRMTFVWSGANGIGKGSHDLYLNGARILTFDSGQTTDSAWKNGNYELFFNFKNHNADNAGVYYFTVPASVVTPGSQSTIKVESGPTEASYAWIMIHYLRNTAGYETASGQLAYDHAGRAREIIVGDCSDGIQNGDETGVDCGGTCANMCLGGDNVKFRYGHYYVRVAPDVLQNAKSYIRDINDLGYPVLTDVLGFSPEIDTYIVDFTYKVSAGVAGSYSGLSTANGVTGGNIALWDRPIRNLAAFPENMCYDLLYETIHGLTEPLKRNIHTYAPRHGVMARGEDFDVIFEVEALDRLGAKVCMSELCAVFYSNSAFPHFPVYYDVREKYGWLPIQMFLSSLNQIKDEIHVNTDDQECYYLSIMAAEDVSPIYEAHNMSITQDTKDMIRRDLLHLQ
jgi:hypothetical protein